MPPARAPVAIAGHRPSGEPPPLPREVSRSTRVFLALGGLVVALWAALTTRLGARVVTAADLAVVRWLADLRNETVESVLDVIAKIGSPWVFRVIGWATLLLLLVVRRFQHLFATLAVFLTVPLVERSVSDGLGRMRPAGVELAGPWDGYAHPSRPVTALALVTTVVVFTLVPAGRWRRRATWIGCGLVAALASARVGLSVDHPTDVAAAAVVGSALPAVAFRLLTPEEVFPVVYRRGVRAHLDVHGRRGEAIKAAVGSQLGVRLQRIEPFGLTGSAGSTPVRLVSEAADHADGQLFGKVYAATHLRSDRWYKLTRTVLYGRLEDEQPFNAVRRLVEYEDHMLRVMRDAGLPTAAPYGIVEITPDREYLVVTEFLDGAEHISDVELTDDVVDDALSCVRRLWDAGLAHRDIKPANVLVRDGRVFLIDLAFAEMRPTPWRQAVDLANMMLTLGICVGADRVYERACRQFSADEIAEAFAASRGVTIPAQLRAMMRTDGRDLVAAYRALAPSRPPVAIQRWSIRRVGLTLGLLAVAVLALALVAENLRLAGLL